MKTSKVNLIYFSPTGTSKRTLKVVVKGLGIKGVEHIDLTPPDAAGKSHMIPAGELAVFAVPVYSGRVPPVAAQRLRTVKGNGTPAVLVAVYGNRAIEDALVELRDITTEQGFKAIAGASFIGEHSFSTEATPIAPGHPDKEDLEKAKKFGEQVKAKLDGMAKPIEITVPGNRPYRERNPSGPRFPDTTVESCTLCVACAEVCPTKSITVSDKVETMKETCTACSACVKACPTKSITVSDKGETMKETCTACSACVKACPMGARVWTNEGVKKAMVWLHTEYSKRREPEFFL